MTLRIAVRYVAGCHINKTRIDLNQRVGPRQDKWRKLVKDLT